MSHNYSSGSESGESMQMKKTSPGRRSKQQQIASRAAHASQRFRKSQQQKKRIQSPRLRKEAEIRRRSQAPLRRAEQAALKLNQNYERMQRLKKLESMALRRKKEAQQKKHSQQQKKRTAGHYTRFGF
jgi:hypothetical protein